MSAKEPEPARGETEVLATVRAAHMQNEIQQCFAEINKLRTQIGNISNYTISKDVDLTNLLLQWNDTLLALRSIPGMVSQANEFKDSNKTNAYASGKDHSSDASSSKPPQPRSDNHTSPTLTRELVEEWFDKLIGIEKRLTSIRMMFESHLIQKKTT